MPESYREQLQQIVSNRQEREAVMVRLGIDPNASADEQMRQVAKIRQALDPSSQESPLPAVKLAPEDLSKMTTSQKIAAGLKASTPASARGTIVTTGESDLDRLARQKRLTQHGTEGMSRASANIMKGLAESRAARGPTKPAA